MKIGGYFIVIAFLVAELFKILFDAISWLVSSWWWQNDRQCFAYIDTPAQPSVHARLQKCIDFWRSLEISRFILNIITQGYKILCFHLPTSFSKANNASARNNSAFVCKAVDDLLKCDSWYYYHSKLDKPVELHNITLYVLSFPGLYRLNHVSRSNDIFFNEGFMVMKVPKRKNVQLCQGDEVVISQLSSHACPVKLLKK